MSRARSSSFVTSLLLLLLTSILPSSQSLFAAPITMGETAVTPVNDSTNANLFIAQQASLSQAATIQSVSFYVTAPGGKLRLGVYDATGPGGGPGAKLAETAEMIPVVGWNTAGTTAQVVLPAGTYWLAYLPSSNALSFRNSQTGAAKYYSFAYGVLPASFSKTPTSGQFHFSFYATLNATTISAAPTVSGLSPNTGSIGGGTQVTISGANFTGATGVSFGGVAASGVSVVSATSITAISPAHAAGKVDVTVTSPAGTSASSASDQFSYVAGQYTVSLSASPSAGGTVNGGGTFAAGTSRTVTAIPNSGYSFLNWTQNGNIVSTSANYTFTINANVILVANFAAPLYTVIASAAPSAGGIVVGGGRFSAGSTQKVSATPNSGYTFVNWTQNGSVVGTATSYSFTLTANTTLAANFASSASQYTVTVSASPSAGGTVTGSGTYAAGSTRTVSATANSGYSFVNWTQNGSVVSTSPSYTFVLSGAVTLIANFSAPGGGFAWNPGMMSKGGIPSRSTICATLAPGNGTTDDSARIQTALG